MTRLLVFLLLTMPPAQSRPAGKMSITLAHRWQVNEARRISVSGKIITTALVMNWGKPIRSAPRRDREFQFVGVERVLGIDEKGKVSRAELTVERMSENGKSLYESGTVITAGPSGFLIGKQPAPADVSNLLHYIAGTQVSGLSDQPYDAVVGKEARSVDESWPVDRSAIAVLSAGSGFEVKPENITGSVQLSLPNDNAKEEELHAAVTASKVGGALSGLKVLDGTMSTRFSYKFTETPQGAEPLAWSQHSTDELFCAGMANDGHPFTLEMREERDLTATALTDTPGPKK